MSFELRPTTHEAFAERLRSAEARKLAELDNTTRKPRSSDRRRAIRMRAIEAKLEELEIQRKHREIWE